MGIFRRVSDIVSANLNDMIEKFEDPERMLRQAIREMEESIGTARRDVAKAMASQKLVGRQLEENRRQVESWAGRATAAVEAGDDDLARKALARKREHERLVAALTDQQEASTQTSQVLRRQLEGMQAKLAEAQRRLGTLSARKRAAEVRTKMATASQGVELKNDAFAKFDRLRRKVETAEAEAEALAELAAEVPADGLNDGRVERSAEELELDAELEALKKQHRQ